MRVEILRLPPAARALLLGMLITISGIWVLSDYADGPMGEDADSREINAEAEMDGQKGEQVEGGLESDVPAGEEAALMNETQEERPATLEEADAQTVDCGGDHEEGAFSFTYWVIDHVVFALADPVPADSGEQAIYEWDWGDGTLSYGGPFMSHHYLEQDARYPVVVARLAEDGAVTHESRQCIEPGLYLVKEGLVEREMIALSGDGDRSTQSMENVTMEPDDPAYGNDHQPPTSAATEPRVEGDLVSWEAWLPGALVAMVLVTLVVALRVNRR